MHCYIATGASKGLGAALVKALLRPGNSVFGVSRSLNEALIVESNEAGLNVFTRAAAREHGRDTAGCEFRFYAVSRGTVDTGMQESLRKAGPSVLANHETYIEWKESGSLVSPEDAASTVLTLLDRDDIENGAFVHRRELTTEDR